MVAVLEHLHVGDAVSTEVAKLAERVRRSVVLIRADGHGTGSGVVWTEDGLIVTNHHVVPRERAEVVDESGRRSWGRVVQRSQWLDLVALRLEESTHGLSLTPASIRPSQSVRPGELVVAVGNPFGERSAATLGIVSAIGSLPWLGGKELIQADITLRPGNSGGALTDADGQVIGIPNMVIGRSLSLAIPTRAVDQFLRGEGPAQGRLGCSGRWVPLTPPLTLEDGLSFVVGFVVTGLEPAGAASAAGMVLGDVIVASIERLPNGAKRIVPGPGFADTILSRKPIDLIVRRGEQWLRLRITPS